VEITTRQLAKCEWNLELASNFFNLLARLASAFFLTESFFAASAHCRNAQQRPDFGEFFSDLASKKFELLASLASALKILIPPLYI
jgi:S-adenosylmethionine:diacylglycerol 3-amino-3-carboxypropyl transferase